MCGNELTVDRFQTLCVGVSANRGPGMQRGQALSEPVIAWWLNVKGVGESLRERYPVPEKASSKFQKLVGKLDAIEGNRLRRQSGIPSDHERMVEALTIGGIKAFPDWFVLT